MGTDLCTLIVRPSRRRNTLRVTQQPSSVLHPRKIVLMSSSFAMSSRGYLQQKDWALTNCPGICSLGSYMSFFLEKKKKPCGSTNLADHSKTHCTDNECLKIVRYTARPNSGASCFSRASDMCGAYSAQVGFSRASQHIRSQLCVYGSATTSWPFFIFWGGRGGAIHVYQSCQ